MTSVLTGEDYGGATVMSMFPFDFSAAPLAPRHRGTRRLSATAVDDSVILDGLAGGSADDPAREVGGVAQLDSAGRRLAFRELRPFGPEPRMIF